jgi:hypothetical protein
VFEKPVNINSEGKHDEDVNVGNMWKRDVVVDIINAVILNMEYEASVKVHQGRECYMFKKP